MYRQRCRVVDALTLMLVAAITAATLFVKQHLVVDVIAGAAWGLGAFVSAKRLCAISCTRVHWIARH